VEGVPEEGWLSGLARQTAQANHFCSGCYAGLQLRERTSGKSLNKSEHSHWQNKPSKSNLIHSFHPSSPHSVSNQGNLDY
jgi:hypothetical protein